MEFNLKSFKNPKNIPNSPGVYFFYNKKNQIIYIGKAKNLKKRIKDHLKAKKQKIYIEHPFSEHLYKELYKIKYIEFLSEIEALIKESEYIRKFQPKYNVMLKDDKKYFYVGFSKEDFPRIFLTHQPYKDVKKADFIGPFTNGVLLKKALRILRKSIPFKTCKNKPEKPCFYYYLGLCPAHFQTKTQKIISQKTTKANTLYLKKILKKGIKKFIKELKAKMEELSKKLEFEKAEKLKQKILALENIHNHTIFVSDKLVIETFDILKKLKLLINMKNFPQRIEVYDVSNLAGDYKVGGMTVFLNGIQEKDLSRRFKIKTKKEKGDPYYIYEIVKRRLKHFKDWGKPDLILIDGGESQINFAKKALDEAKIKDIKLISLAKNSKILYNYYNNKLKKIDLKKLDKSIFNFINKLIKSSHNFSKRYLNKILIKSIK